MEYLGEPAVGLDSDSESTQDDSKRGKQMLLNGVLVVDGKITTLMERRAISEIKLYRRGPISLIIRNCQQTDVIDGVLQAARPLLKELTISNCLLSHSIQQFLQNLPEQLEHLCLDNLKTDLPLISAQLIQDLRTEKTKIPASVLESELSFRRIKSLTLSKLQLTTFQTMILLSPFLEQIDLSYNPLRPSVL